MKLIKRNKSQEALKREMLLKNAKEQFKRLNKFGIQFNLTAQV
jgi:hypothetical protein